MSLGGAFDPFDPGSGAGAFLGAQCHAHTNQRWPEWIKECDACSPSTALAHRKAVGTPLAGVGSESSDDGAAEAREGDAMKIQERDAPQTEARERDASLDLDAIEAHAQPCATDEPEIERGVFRMHIRQLVARVRELEAERIGGDGLTHWSWPDLVRVERERADGVPDA
jgi:hypothetical protein